MNLPHFLLLILDLGYIVNIQRKDLACIRITILLDRAVEGIYCLPVSKVIYYLLVSRVIYYSSVNRVIYYLPVSRAIYYLPVSRVIYYLPVSRVIYYLPVIFLPVKCLHKSGFTGLQFTLDT